VSPKGGDENRKKGNNFHKVSMPLRHRAGQKGEELVGVSWGDKEMLLTGGAKWVGRVGSGGMAARTIKSERI